MEYNDIFIESKLPKPLNKEELYECIIQAREGNLEARNKVVIHNIKLVINQVLKKFVDTPYEKKELIAIGTIGLIKAADTFNIEKNLLFATYATRCIDNEILMFIRKGKKYLDDESFDNPISSKEDGNELKIEDIIADKNIDYENKLLKEELLLEVRKQFDMLEEGRNKEIIKLYFGFDGYKQYSQKNIGDMFGLSQSYVNRIVNRIVNKIKINLEEQNLIETAQSKTVPVKGSFDNRKESIEMARELQSIYEYFNQFTKDEINIMLTKLTEEEKELVNLRYGDDLEHPKTSEKWNKENYTKFYGVLLPKMKKLLLNPNDEIKCRKSRAKKSIESGEKKQIISDSFVEQQIIEDKTSELPLEVPQVNQLSGNDSVTKEECTKILELLRTPTFTQMMEVLSPKDAVIISLKLGYVDGKYFSTESIAEFLGLEEDEVREIIKKILLLYKTNINEFIDNVVKIAMDEPIVLSLKVNNK